MNITSEKRRAIKRPKSKKSARKVSRQEDRSLKIYKFIEEWLRANPDVPENKILKALKNKPIYNHYREQDADAETRARKDIRRIKQKIFGEKPEPPNQVLDFPLEQIGMTEEMSSMLRSHCENMAMATTERLRISASVMEQLYFMQEKSILNFPCASGKTTAAIALAATYASSENRMWIVTEKVQDVCRIAEDLRKLGCNALEWHGYNSSLCHIAREVFISHKNGYFCRRCENQCTAKHKYLSKISWDSLDCDVLVTTHSHWQATVDSENFHESVNFVIVDESPALMEFFSLDEDNIRSIRKIFHYNEKLIKQFNIDIGYIRSRCDVGGCYRIPYLNTLQHTREIIKCIHKLLAEGKISTEEFELVKNFINFFSSTEIYGMKEYPDGKYRLSFIRGNVDIRTSVPHMVLDGSALMSDSFWEGFTIYKCNALKQTYPNTTLDILQANPSKTVLRRSDKFGQLHAMIIETIINTPSVIENKSPIVVFQNKELENDKELKENLGRLQSELNSLDLNIIDMYRGEHIGSNKARDAVLCAVAMSLFNNLSYYVLRTALVNNCDIPPEQIWKKKFNTPHMKSNGGFCNYDIQKTYCRTLVVDLYQTIMRGCVRVNPDAKYNVICTLSGPDVINILKEELPGAQFRYEHADVVDAIMAGESKAEIMRKYDIKRTQLNNLFKTLKVT